MGKSDCYAKAESSKCLIDRICNLFSDGVHFAAPISSLRTNEVDLVRGVLRMLQGFSSSLFYWDRIKQSFCAKSGIYVTHLSQTSLNVLLNQFIYSATCLQLVEIVVSEVQSSMRFTPPTLRAFACSVSSWLKTLRDIALKEEMKIKKSEVGISTTLMGLASSLSSLCSGAECLLQIVHGAIPQAYFDPHSFVPAAELAVHVLDHLYGKLDEVCLLQGGEEEAYQMLIHVFVGSLLPFVEGLDTWLFEGTLDDPFEEMFFYASTAISVDGPEFWENSYLMRRVQCGNLDVAPSAQTHDGGCAPLENKKKETRENEPISLSRSTKGKDQSSRDPQVCPLFIMNMAKSIVSAGKSLQLIRHVPRTFSLSSQEDTNGRADAFGSCNEDGGLSKTHHRQSIAGLTLSEIFCISLAGLIGNSDHISRHFWQAEGKCEIVPLLLSCMNGQMLEKRNGDALCSEKMWCKFLVETLSQKRSIDLVETLAQARSIALEHAQMDASVLFEKKEKNTDAGNADSLPLQRSFYPENPVITVCQSSLDRNRDSWRSLNLSKNFSLPPLNDETLRQSIFGGESGQFSGVQTHYSFGFFFNEFNHLRSQDDAKLLEVLFPFPTVLPSFKDNLRLSELLPFQKNSTLPSRVLDWIQGVEPRTTLLPVVVVQECLTVYIKNQVDWIGGLILSKLMKEWKLMEELAVLRAIYLLGSGDLLQHFLTVIFNKLDKGESWDDDFELNTILQESIRNSADGMILSTPDSLEVSITKDPPDAIKLATITTTASTPRRSRVHSFGIDGLDSLKFTYKITWPLELIANTEAVKKYNQVMAFLLKVKRAKFVLDKARRWMWKDKGIPTSSCKHHWLVEQKLLHFVDAFHRYVMDRVYHSAWRELCEGMAAAGSLDEVIEVHEAYLLSIQRQCFVVPDKLWALIASRINSILGLALDFYSIQQTLSSGGAVSAIKARCEVEVDRIEKQFDDCIAFLLRVLSFKLNVGHFPHLADLVTRINYNYFYMSDSGNLMTAPGSETVTSRLGNAFASRTD